MAAISTVAAIVGAIAGVAGAGYGVYSGEKAAGAQRDAMDEANRVQAAQDAENNKLKQQAKDRATIEEANRQREAQKMRMQTQAAGLRGRSSTLLTGPSGLGAAPGTAPAASASGSVPVPGNKTLLGS